MPFPVRRLHVAKVALIVAIVVTSTAADGDGAAHIRVDDACALVTQAEAAAALGAAVPAGASKVMNLPMQGATIRTEYCFYGTEVVVARFDLGKDAKNTFAQYRQSLSSRSDYADIGALGDDAFVAKGQVAVRKGQWGLIIDVGQARGGGPKEVAAEKSLAKMALGRLEAAR